MRKIRKLNLFVILGIVICALIFIGISSLEAQRKGKPVKPPPEPEDTWAVQLPSTGNGIDTMLYGDGDMYINNDNDVRIKVEKGGTRLRKGQTVFYYYFSFKLLNSTGRHAGFQDVFLTKKGNPDVGLPGIFPGDCENIDPTICMENFLNQDQPHPEYEYFNLKFQVGQYSFEQASVICEGIEDMPYETPVKFTSNSDWIKIRVQNQEDFLDPYENHNVECDERNYDDDVLTNMNIWIVRLDESDPTYYSNEITSSDGVWRICVGYEHNAGSSPGADLLFQEQYTQRAVGKGKKGGSKTVTVVPLEATGTFSFYIDFIKNPTTE